MFTKEEVGKALKKMKKSKAPGVAEVVAVMITAAGDLGVEWMTMQHIRRFGIEKGAV